MADSDKTLKLLIELGVVGKEDAEAVPKLLDEQKAATAGLAKEMGVVTVSGDEAAKILGKTGEKAEMSHGSLRRLAHAMGSEIPGGAALMESGFTMAENGMMGATFLLVGGIELLKSAIEKLNQEGAAAAKIADALADADGKHSEVVDKEREALENAEVAQAEFYHNYLRNTHDALAAAEQFADAVRKTTFERANTEDDSRKKVMEGELADMEKRGVITHEQAEQDKEQIDLQFMARKLQRQEQMDRAEEAALDRQRFAKNVAAKNDLTAAAGAEINYEKAAQAKAANDQKIEEAKAKIAAGEDAKKALRENGVTEESAQHVRLLYEEMSGKPSSGAGAIPLSDQFNWLAKNNIAGGDFESLKLVHDLGAYGDKNLATYEGADIDIKAGKSDLARAKKKSAGLDIAEGNSKSDLEYMRGRAQKDRDAAADLDDKYTTTRATNAIKEQGARTDFGLDAAATALHGHATNINNFMGQVNRLAGAMAQMSPNQVLELERRVQQVESQVANARNNYH